MIRKCSAKIIPALWCSALLAACALLVSAAAPPRSPARPLTLAALVRAYRESPTPAKRGSVEAYANAHAGESNGALARLALGVSAYEQKDFASAIADLRGIAPKLPAISDY